MNSLKQTLEIYADPSPLGGDGELSPSQVKQLKLHLRNLRRKNFYTIVVCSILALAGLAYIIFSTSDPETMKNAIGKSSVVGVSIAGIVGFIYSRWKELGYINLLYIFLDSMDGAILKSIVTETWKKL